MENTVKGIEKNGDLKKGTEIGSNALLRFQSGGRMLNTLKIFRIYSFNLGIVLIAHSILVE
jgi:hypothetical protein